MARHFVDALPGMLLLPPSRLNGADPVKLARQVSNFGSTFNGMPTIECYELADSPGEYVVWDGVTRATRAARLAPTQLVRIEVLGKIRLSPSVPRRRV